MGRREAWSADRTSDSRTKPTRWEFQQARGDDYKEKLEDHHRSDVDDTHQASHLDTMEGGSHKAKRNK